MTHTGVSPRPYVALVASNATPWGTFWFVFTGAVIAWVMWLSWPFIGRLLAGADSAAKDEDVKILNETQPQRRLAKVVAIVMTVLSVIALVYALIR